MFGNKRECCVCGRRFNRNAMLEIAFSHTMNGIEDTRRMWVCRPCHEQAALERVNQIVMARTYES